MTSAQSKAEEFLKNASYFHLGSLPTESSHPKTSALSDLAQNNLQQAVQILKDVDLEALKKFNSYLPDLTSLTEAIEDTLQSKGRIFLCGCGATGRLSLSLEYLWRLQHPENSEAVVGFMAGGDVALVNSIEGFEDFTEYGAEHLLSLGFGENDLLISSTEGGETSYVIGATEKAAEISKRKPFFLFCNPKEILIDHVERSRRVLQNSQIHNICVEVGPMALSGSTRMQASTVLMLSIGYSLFKHKPQELTDFIEFFEKSDISSICDFIKLESEIYQQNNRILYSAEDLAITVFTDTTERSPTFSLPPFANKFQNSTDDSFAYIMIPSAQDTQQSWQKLLLRKPRSLNWPERSAKTTENYLEGFDFSKQALLYREQRLPNSQHFIFTIEHEDHKILWKLQNLKMYFKVSSSGLLFDHIFLKLLLNIHSTLIMSRLGRTNSNFMTYVSPTNGKLIDRATRYVLLLLNQNSVFGITYEQAVHELFNQLESLKTGEAIVMKTYEALKSRYK